MFTQFLQNPNLRSSTIFNLTSSSSVINHSEFISFNRRKKATVALCYNMEGEKEVKLWGGRFEEGVTDVVERFTESISYDKELYKYDIMGSCAHASMLAKQGLISSKEKDSILEGLDEIKKRIESGKFTWRIDREDVHMNIEASLTDLIGEAAKKLHTARSRNDQVSTDLRLWCRDAIDEIIAHIKDLQVPLMSVAMKNEGVNVPRYTSLRRAQPILLHRHLVEYVQQLNLDVGRFQDCREGLNFCPLGACALAGTGLPIDRFMTSDSLGFAAPMRNSIDAVSDRDFVLELLSCNSITAMHLSEEFGFITTSDSVSTGSNIMPQEKYRNPLDLVREKAAKVAAHVITLQVLCKGLPLSYNRDMQEDKEPVFDSVKTILEMLEVLSEFAENVASKEGSCNSVRDTILEIPPEKKIESGEFTPISQNNQVLTEFHLWCEDVIDKIFARVQHLQVALVSLAMENEGVIVPGYTHMQRAQPILLQHHLLVYVEQLDRDARRLLNCKKRLSEECTLADTGLPIDDSFMQNSRVSKRAFLLELLSVNSIIALHLSRLGEEWVLWASEEFGFIIPSDSVSTGSSIMPQKKNPDSMELVRGKSARVIGDHVTVQMLYTTLPLSSTRDLQEEKKPVFDSIKTIIDTLEVASEFAQNITFNRGRIQKALPAGHLDATTLADYLVLKGVPFRTSHDIVGKAVALCVHKECELQNLSLDELQSINMVFDTDVYDYLGVENSIKKFTSYGSTGSNCVADQLAFWIKKLDINN